MNPLILADSLSPWEPGIFSLVIFGMLVFVIIGVLLFLTSWLGEKKPNPEKLRPYECGIIPTGDARVRYPVPFYLIAVFFLIFDIEGVFIFSWAVSCQYLGWKGWFQICFFILTLLIGLVYIIKNGGLSWGTLKTKE